MLFSSNIFIFYFLPIIIMLYYIFSFSRVMKNFILLIGSLIFYAWGEPEYIILMITSIIVNYILGLLVHKFRERKNASKLVVVIMLIFNLGILIIFKYLSFILRNISQYTKTVIEIPNIILPIGISFFTFQCISYVIDVYRKDVQVQKNPMYLGLYVSLFPQLVAGPIVRYSTISDQILNRKETIRKFSVGMCRFITGLAKKIIISNSLAVIVDRIFIMNDNLTMTTSLAWLGSIAYTLQIYFDFSGYSDMAIGLGLLFGFKFNENFNYPYISKSISEFWRRWHISLGEWFRDYVYIPLGGSRVKNKDKMVRNLFVVWILTGIWHGAEWNFLFWGVYNFVFIVIEKVFSFEKMEGKNILKHVYTLFIVNLGWVIFRSKDLYSAGRYISSMFGFSKAGMWSSYTWMFIKENLLIIIISIILCTPIAKKINKMVVDKQKGYKFFNILYPVAIVGIFIIAISYLVKGVYNPFIYFNF